MDVTEGTTVTAAVLLGKIVGVAVGCVGGEGGTAHEPSSRRSSSSVAMRMP